MRSGHSFRVYSLSLIKQEVLKVQGTISSCSLSGIIYPGLKKGPFQPYFSMIYEIY